MHATHLHLFRHSVLPLCSAFLHHLHAGVRIAALDLFKQRLRKRAAEGVGVRAVARKNDIAEKLKHFAVRVVACQLPVGRVGENEAEVPF